MAASPPYYILISQTDLAANPSQQPALSSSLSHPIIQFHYADDSPLALLPQSPNEQVLVLDYDPSSSSAQPIAKSISHNVALSGMKVAEAPGAGATLEAGDKKVNDKMYILEFITANEERSVCTL